MAAKKTKAAQEQLPDVIYRPLTGRPPKYQSLNQFVEIINNYFEITKYPSVSGLCNHLGITVNTLREYEGLVEGLDTKPKEFSHAIKMARQFIEESRETACMTFDRAAGPIFLLKSQHGYIEQQPEQGPQGGIHLEINVVNHDGSSNQTIDIAPVKVVDKADVDCKALPDKTKR